MDSTWSRREFVGLGAAALAAAWHPASLFASSKPPAQTGKPLIRSMRLRTSAPLEVMRDFYGSELGLRTSPIQGSEFSLSTGGTEISFVEEAGAGKNLHHHFAFNIPQNQIRQALDWVKPRVDLIPAWGDLGEASFPKEIVHFRHWNAKSLFFFDPAYNLVELIARHELRNDETRRFSSASLLYASEIGLPTSTPEATARKLNKDLGLKGYPNGTPPQFAMGDANGLLLCLKQDQLWGGHTGTPIQWGKHAVDLILAGPAQKKYALEGYPYRIEFKTD